MKKEIMLMLAINIMSSMGYSLIAPLFPPLATERQICENICGIIISVYATSNFLLTPFCPYLIGKFSRKRLFYFATILEASCTVLYGFLKYINEYYTFIFFAAAGRLWHGIGSGITAVLIYSLTATLSDPEHAKSNLGLMELGWCVGVAVGPVIASVFYHIGGYALPFLALGTMLYISVYFIYQLELPMEDSQLEPPQFLNLFLKFEILLAFFNPMMDIISKSFFFPTFTNHLMNNFGLSMEGASIFFVINMVSYFFFLQFLNPVTKFLGLKLTMVFGLLSISLGTLFLPPIPLLPQCVITIIVGLLILGISGAFINIPYICDTYLILKANDPKLDENTANDLASTIINLSLNCGEIIGPIFGGYVTERQSFQASCLWTGGMALCLAGVYFFVNLGKIKEYWKNGMGTGTEEKGLREKLATTGEDYGEKKSIRGSIVDKEYVSHHRAYSYSSYSSRNKKMSRSINENIS